jgi:carbon storage regulator
MLILSRKRGEKVVIGLGVTVTVLEVVGGRVRLGFEAPGQVGIFRGELAPRRDLDAAAGAGKEAASPGRPARRREEPSQTARAR